MKNLTIHEFREKYAIPDALPPGMLRSDDAIAAIRFTDVLNMKMTVWLSKPAAENLKETDLLNEETWESFYFSEWIHNDGQKYMRIDKKSEHMVLADVEGSKWKVKPASAGTSSGETVMEFLRGGSLTYGEFGGTWRFENGIAYFSFSTLHTDIEGHIVKNSFYGIVSDPFLGLREQLSGELIFKHPNARKYRLTLDDLFGESDADLLVQSILETIKDYRSDENNPEVAMSGERIRTWIGQFDPRHRIALLTETDNILKKRYCSANSARNFMIGMLRKLSEVHGHPSPADFLRNAVFLDLQPPGKSQGEMLRMLDSVISLSFGISLAQCGSVSKKYSIYLDDVLCTGKTLYDDIEEWSGMAFSERKSNRRAVEDGSTLLILAYIFVHDRNYRKCKTRLKINVSEEFAGRVRMFRKTLIQNEVDDQSKIDLILPAEGSHPEAVTEYRNEITARADNWNQRYGMISPEEFFRPAGWPQEEAFFTSPQNRMLTENSFLLKGIEILKTANAVNPNIRALGYSIPSHKNFGFGALCFTWRNIPNNTPLVFWYSAGNFTPLFQVKRGLYLDPGAPASAPQDDDLPF